MKRLLRIFITFILCVCCALPFFACDGNVVNSNSVINPRTETIKVGYVDYAPLNYMHRNTFKGFNTELAVMTFNALGYNVEFILIEPEDEDDYFPTAEDVYCALEDERIDCFWGGISNAVLNDDTRADFSVPYIENSVCLVNKFSLSYDATSLEDLANKTIAFGKNSAGELFYNSYLSSAVTGTTALSCVKGQKAALHALLPLTNQASFALVDTLHALYLTNNDEDYNSDTIINRSFQFEQKSYLRVVFAKSLDGATPIPNELRDNVNIMLKTFASVIKDEKSLIQTLAENYKFTKSGKTLADFLVDLNA